MSISIKINALLGITGWLFAARACAFDKESKLAFLNCIYDGAMGKSIPRHAEVNGY